MSSGIEADAILFDLYLTLIDIHTDEAKVELWDKLALFLSYRYVVSESLELRERYFALLEEDRLARSEAYAEVDVRAVFQRLLMELSCDDAVPASTEITRLFRALSMERFRVFPDVLPCLERLHGRFALGIVSDAQPLFLWPELSRAKLRPMFDVIVVSGEHGFRKPDPRLLTQALTHVGVPPDRAIFVGDRIDRDVEAAQAANIRSVLVDRHGQDLESSNDARPDWVVSDLNELCDRLAE